MSRTPKPDGCTGCPLRNIGVGFVSLTPPAQYDGIRLLVQGEAPGKDEVDESSAFVGKAGHWIRKNILHTAGVLEPQVLFDNTLRCLPPLNKKGEHYPIGEDREQAETFCRAYDRWHLVPRHIPLLLVGSKPLEQRLGIGGISDYHGHITYHEGRLTGTTFHPAAVMRQPNLLPVAVREVGNLLEAAANPRVLERPQVVKHVLPYREGAEAVCDLEWNGSTVTAVGLSYEPAQAFSTFNAEEGLEVVRQHILNGTRIIGHNFISADLPKIGVLPQSWGPQHIVDTMIVAHLIHAHLAELGMLGLGDLTRFYFPTTDWKQQKEDLLHYNGLDSAYNMKLWQQLKLDLDATEQWHLVEKQQTLAYMSSQMHERGVKIDVPALTEFYQSRAAEKAAQKATFDFNPNSPKQIKEWLYEAHGIRVGSTDIDTLEKLAGRHPDIDRLIEYRQDTKSLSTWFPIETDKKGNLVGIEEFTYPEFKVTGTAVARFSCANPNFQNLPPRLRRFIIPRDPSLELVSFDGSQIENRTVAWIAGEDKMMEAFNSGMDFHQANAANIYNKRFEDVTGEERQFGKTVTHATNYLETPYNLAERLYGNRKHESLSRAKALQQGYFSAYPKIQAWHKSVTAQLDRGDIMLSNPFGRKRFIYAQSSHERAKRGCHFLGCSTAADIINAGAVRVWRALGLLPILIVHDELVYELPKGEAGAKLRWQIKEILEEPIAEMNGLVIPMGCKLGPNYLEMEKVKMERKVLAV